MGRRFAVVSAFCLTLMFVAAQLAPAARAEDDAVDRYVVEIAGAATRGTAYAPITIVEFSDFSCQFCVRVQTTLSQLDRLYPGLIRHVFRHNPLDLAEGTLAAEAAAAAQRQGKFWPMHDRLFAAMGRVDRSTVERFARELGLDLIQFGADLDRGSHLAQIRADAAAVTKLGVRGTPYFFINGRPLRGAQSAAVFAEMIAEELAAIPAANHFRSDGADAQYATWMAGATTTEPIGTRGDHDRIEVTPQLQYALHDGLPGHSIGPVDALVTIVEFTDFQCPYCAKMAPTIERVRRELPNDVRIVVRHLPLGFHEFAVGAGEALAEAAAQGKMWEMHQRLFDSSSMLAPSDLERHAAAIGLDVENFRAALADGRHREAVVADAAAAAGLGISGTPTVFVNGTPMSGAVPYDVVRAMVDAKLAEAQQLEASGVPRGDVHALLSLRASVMEKGDPSRAVAGATVGAVGLSADEALRSTHFACLVRDHAAAAERYQALSGPRRAIARQVCLPFGIRLTDGASSAAP